MFPLVWLLLTPGQIEPLPASEFTKDLQTSAVQATVLITCPDKGAVGSGVIIGKSGLFVYILTADHVVTGAKELEVRTFSAASYPKPVKIYRGAQVVAQAPNDDLALVRLTTGDAMPATLKICPPHLVPAKGGVAAMTVGCGGGDPPTCLLAHVNGKKLVRKREEDAARPCWELSKAQAKGRSGGPLLDRNGHVLGISSLNHKDVSYCCHTDAIYSLLRKNALTHLYDGERK